MSTDVHGSISLIRLDQLMITPFSKYSINILHVVNFIFNNESLVNMTCTRSMHSEQAMADLGFCEERVKRERPSFLPFPFSSFPSPPLPIFSVFLHPLFLIPPHFPVSQPFLPFPSFLAFPPLSATKRPKSRDVRRIFDCKGPTWRPVKVMTFFSRHRL